MPNRIYTDTALTEQAVFTHSSYEKIKYDNNFNTGRQQRQGSSGMSTTVANGSLEASSTVVDKDITVYYHTTPGMKYRLSLTLAYGTADSIDVKLHNQSPQTLLYSDARAANGQTEYEFTAATDSIRLRLKRKDHSGQGALSFFVERSVLRIVRDTMYQDTVTLATAAGYRYGFNGMMKDDKLNGVGNSYDFGARIYDARIGRFLSVDPAFKKYSYMSPYLFAGNNPVANIDSCGEGPAPVGKLSNSDLEAVFNAFNNAILEYQYNDGKEDGENYVTGFETETSGEVNGKSAENTQYKGLPLQESDNKIKIQLPNGESINANVHFRRSYITGNNTVRRVEQSGKITPLLASSPGWGFTLYGNGANGGRILGYLAFDNQSDYDKYVEYTKGKYYEAKSLSIEKTSKKEGYGTYYSDYYKRKDPNAFKKHKGPVKVFGEDGNELKVKEDVEIE